MSRTDYRFGRNALEDLSQDMERVFDSVLGRTARSVLRGCDAQHFTPPLDVTESETAFEVHVDLPGVAPENVKLEMHEGKLSIVGSRGLRDESDEKLTHHRVERSSGQFHRVVSLPQDVDTAAIDAQYNHGVLTIKLPKIAKPQPTQIEIRTGE